MYIKVPRFIRNIIALIRASGNVNSPQGCRPIVGVAVRVQVQSVWHGRSPASPFEAARDHFQMGDAADTDGGVALRTDAQYLGRATRQLDEAAYHERATIIYTDEDGSSGFERCHFDVGWKRQCGMRADGAGPELLATRRAIAGFAAVPACIADLIEMRRSCRDIGDAANCVGTSNLDGVSESGRYLHNRRARDPGDVAEMRRSVTRPALFDDRVCQCGIKREFSSFSEDPVTHSWSRSFKCMIAMSELAYDTASGTAGSQSRSWPATDRRIRFGST